MTINECRVRGIHLTHLCKLSIAYLEFWASPPSVELENALRAILDRKPQKSLILSLPQCAALRVLGGFRAWSIEINNNGERFLKSSGHEYDINRTKRRRGYTNREYGLLRHAGGTVSAFESLNAERVLAMSVKARSGGRMVIFIDRFGQETEARHDLDTIFWFRKSMNFRAGRKLCPGQDPSIFWDLCGILIVVFLGYLIVLLHLSLLQRYGIR